MYVRFKLTHPPDPQEYDIISAGSQGLDMVFKCPYVIMKPYEDASILWKQLTRLYLFQVEVLNDSIEEVNVLNWKLG